MRFQAIRRKLSFAADSDSFDITPDSSTDVSSSSYSVPSTSSSDDSTITIPESGDSAAGSDSISTANPSTVEEIISTLGETETPAVDVSKLSPPEVITEIPKADPVDIPFVISEVSPFS